MAALFGNDFGSAADECAVTAREALDDRDARAALGEYDGIRKGVGSAGDIVGHQNRLVTRCVGRHVYKRTEACEGGRERAELGLRCAGSTESAREQRAVFGSGGAQIARDRARIRVLDSNRARIRSKRRQIELEGIEIDLPITSGPFAPRGRRSVTLAGGRSRVARKQPVLEGVQAIAPCSSRMAS